MLHAPYLQSQKKNAYKHNKVGSIVRRLSNTDASVLAALTISLKLDDKRKFSCTLAVLTLSFKILL